MRRPLDGKTVVLTRPRRPSDPLAAALRKAGARVVWAPLIRVIPPPSTKALDAALRDLESYDALVFTSANAVAAVRRRRAALGLRARARRVLAVGPATAKAARGLGPVTVAAEHRAEGVARLLKRGWKVLWPRAEKPAARFPGAVAPVAYRTVPDPAGLRLYRPADAVIFASGSAVDAFRRARLPLGEAVAVSIGPATSKALRGLRAVQAARPTPAAVVEAVRRGLHA